MFYCLSSYTILMMVSGVSMILIEEGHGVRHGACGRNQPEITKKIYRNIINCESEVTVEIVRLFTASLYHCPIEIL